MNEHSNSLLSQILAEQMKQTEILQQMAQQQSQMVQILNGEELQDGEEIVEREQPQATYLDGSPCL
ncbi:hypothetical protein [Pseudomonas syringae]|uniref:Uncharacterized protein n=1 Tax=Pseudomonas syringae TaxID=317 RepID=A0A085V6R0_PSESX|nr:hypothetical protein [Pseudomonas syringae]KFE51123.1 hypothetical protein IV02_14050 [Pseudomonas syringae]